MLIKTDKRQQQALTVPVKLIFGGRGRKSQKKKGREKMGTVER